METKIPVEVLKQQKLFLAVPMYGGQCAGMFARSLSDLTNLCVRYGIKMQFYFLFNESLVTRARNYCADEFMRSDCTHLMFIDSDIGFDAHDVISLLGLSSMNEDYNVLCGPYPKKTISWEKIKQAVDKGVADKDPNILENFVGDYVFNPKKGLSTIPLNQPVEVMESGTGFMLIQRKVFEAYNKHFPQMLYKPDHVRTENFDGSREIMAYFDAIIDDKSQNMVAEVEAFVKQTPNATHDDIIEFLRDKKNGLTSAYSNRYLSEDYMFCYNVQKMGMKVWLCPWMQLKHVGSYIFGGSLAALASVGASATADTKKLGRKRK